jgi:hypothetical protein
MGRTLSLLLVIIGILTYNSGGYNETKEMKDEVRIPASQIPAAGSPLQGDLIS